MSNEEITEGNKLLAEFMKVTLEGNERNGFWLVGEGVPQPFTQHLGYHSSWDWIWPVIDKINGLGKAYSFATFKTYMSLTVEKSGNKMYKDFSFAHAEYITAEQTSKEAAFKLLTRFVKWHNEHVLQIETV
jgi:hypothetical protein